MLFQMNKKSESLTHSLPILRSKCKLTWPTVKAPLLLIIFHVILSLKNEYIEVTKSSANIIMAKSSKTKSSSSWRFKKWHQFKKGSKSQEMFYQVKNPMKHSMKDMNIIICYNCEIRSCTKPKEVIPFSIFFPSGLMLTGSHPFHIF